MELKSADVRNITFECINLDIAEEAQDLLEKMGFLVEVPFIRPHNKKQKRQKGKGGIVFIANWPGDIKEPEILVIKQHIEDFEQKYAGCLTIW